MDIFLKESYKYRLGEMATEKPHPMTKNLSEISQTDLPKALRTLKEVDLKALDSLIECSTQIESLKVAIQETLKNEGRIFLCGCGATGRLSLLIEFLWREQNPGSEQVFSLMAGGDIALVNSIEGFEDYPEYGKRHLIQMGFKENDLLISTTEGGETPYVIGATEAATEISQRKPYFIYCNPDELLVSRVERSKKVIENSNIEKICLFVGPMALSGSTRMQASTVLQLAVGSALLEQEVNIEKTLKEFKELVKKTNFLKLGKFVEKESSIYQSGGRIMYVPHSYAITVFTDTTERSPTFSLPPFEDKNYSGDSPSLCYIMVPGAENEKVAWQKLLNHQPRPLDWGEIDERTMTSCLEIFDFSENAKTHRQKHIDIEKQKNFSIKSDKGQMSFELDGLKESFDVNGFASLYQHTLLKLLLNTHSTLLMGRLGRYKSNIMTWVAPTNGKLIDRSARYVQALLRERNIEKTYEEVIKRIFEKKEKRKDGEPIVLQTFESFIQE